MEYDRHVGMGRKYGAVRIQTLKSVPVTVSKNTDLIVLQFEFVEDTTNGKRDNQLQWFLIIDSRQFENTINCENIEDFSENKDKKLTLSYYIPDEKSNSKFLRKQENYDCCENNNMLKTFQGI